MISAACRHLERIEPKFGPLIRRVGPCSLKSERYRSPYAALLRAIAHQQLNGRAAEAIFGRFLALFPGEEFPEPSRVLEASSEAMRACGLSQSKIASIRAISEAALDGVVPTRRAAARLSDEALIERLVALRGVGRWTVEMLLIFTLGRPDVLPVDDFGVREGYRLLFGLDAQPRPRALGELGAAWAPYRSTAAWYLWQRAGEAKRVKPEPLPQETAIAPPAAPPAARRVPNGRPPRSSRIRRPERAS